MPKYNSNGVKIDTVGTRDLKFSDWVRNNLPNTATGQTVTDLDFIFKNYKTKQIMCVEVKTRNANLKRHQKETFSEMNKALKIGYANTDWTYHGFHFLVFERTCFDDGKCFLNNKLITEKDAIDFLSFKTLPRKVNDNQFANHLVFDLTIKAENLSGLGMSFKDDADLSLNMSFRRDNAGWWYRDGRNLRFVGGYTDARCEILEKIYLTNLI